jgi:hypothetical protein
MRNSGSSVHRRNVELVAKGLVNHVELTEEMEGYVPGDVVPYSLLEKYYQPREDALVSDVAVSKDKYLEKPVLHYTIGTKLNSAMVKELDDFGIKEVMVHKDPPPFTPIMVRGAAVSQYDLDFGTQMYGSGLKKNLLNGVGRGQTADITGTSYVSGLAFNKDYGKPGKSKIEAPIYHLNQIKQAERFDDIYDDFDDDD